MNRFTLTATLFVLSIALGFAQGGARVLFDGTSLDGWNRLGDANWTLANGAVQATEGKGGHLVSKEQFGDFELTVEVWVEAATTNSGVFIRCPDPTSISPTTCYEINVWDARPDPIYATGGIVNVAKVIAPTKAAGQWTTVVITARGPKMMVSVNGVKTSEGENTQFARGHITLQYGGPGTVRFRKAQIRPL
ncbi:MAG: DUF1080 domain-containing protein [Vicinamibacterales bacterium]